MNKLLIIFAVLCSSVFGQVSADLTIENQEAVGTDFFFDIYLTRTGENDLYLGTADFALTFNSAAFTDPVVTRESFSYWNLTSTNSIPVGIFYRMATSPAAITGNEIIINLNQVNFGNQSDFDDFIAKIDNTPNIHCVGRYKVSGITNTSANMNLQWKVSGAGVTTQVFTLEAVSPWNSSLVNTNAINPPDAPLPVELTSFTAKANGDKVDLSWKTATEINNYGFDIERSIKSGENEEPLWVTIGFIEGNGNSNSPKQYSFTDKNPYGGSRFVYRLKQIDTDGSYEYSDEIEVEIVPTIYVLYQNYPNPFNPITNIKFSLPEAAKVSIMVYNSLGELVTELVNKDFDAGYHKVEFRANQYASGVYIYRLVSKNFVETKKMLMIK